MSKKERKKDIFTLTGEKIIEYNDKSTEYLQKTLHIKNTDVIGAFKLLVASSIILVGCYIAAPYVDKVPSNTNNTKQVYTETKQHRTEDKSNATTNKTEVKESNNTNTENTTNNTDLYIDPEGNYIYTFTNVYGWSAKSTRVAYLSKIKDTCQELQNKNLPDSTQVNFIFKNDVINSKGQTHQAVIYSGRITIGEIKQCNFDLMTNDNIETNLTDLINRVNKYY